MSSYPKKQRIPKSYFEPVIQPFTSKKTQAEPEVSEGLKQYLLED